MNYKLLLAGLIVLLVVGVTFFVRMNQEGYRDMQQQQGTVDAGKQESSKTPVSTPPENLKSLPSVPVPPVQPPADSGKVPLSELASHDSLKDCWVAYDGKVYDISSFLPRHPGSAGAISPYCGTADGFTKAFEGQHGKSKVKNLMKVGVLMGDFDVMGTTA